MGTKFRLSALCVAMLSTSIVIASDSSKTGQYTTRIAEDKLFIEDGKVLRCDLFFCKPDGETVVAPKGSRLVQSLPPVVWQYSRLLPAADYLKTAHIHSVSSEKQYFSWQEVQDNFYAGLLVEGASDTDAKIAFAGAYAFAPRWPLLEFVEVDEAEPKYPDSILFRVKYNQPPVAGMTVQDYRSLSMRILQKPDALSLQDIQATIDSADNSEKKSRDLAPLGGISSRGSDLRISKSGSDSEIVVGGLTSGGNTKVLSKSDSVVATAVNVVIAGESLGSVATAEKDSTSTVATVASAAEQDSANIENPVGIVVAGGGFLLQGDGLVVTKAGDKLVSANTQKTADKSDSKEAVATASSLPSSNDANNTEDTYSTGVFDIETFEVKEGVVDNALLPRVTQPAEIVKESVDKLISADTTKSTETLAELDGSEDEWTTMPDGTLVLRRVGKQVSY